MVRTHKSRVQITMPASKDPRTRNWPDTTVQFRSAAPADPTTKNDGSNHDARAPSVPTTTGQLVRASKFEPAKHHQSRRRKTLPLLELQPIQRKEKRLTIDYSRGSRMSSDDEMVYCSTCRRRMPRKHKCWIPKKELGGQ